MSLWEFLAATDGLRAFHGGGKSRPAGDGLSEDRLREMGIDGFD